MMIPGSMPFSAKGWADIESAVLAVADRGTRNLNLLLRVSPWRFLCVIVGRLCRWQHCKFPPCSFPTVVSSPCPHMLGMRQQALAPLSAYQARSVPGDSDY